MNEVFMHLDGQWQWAAINTKSKKIASVKLKGAPPAPPGGWKSSVGKQHEFNLKTKKWNRVWVEAKSERPDGLKCATCGKPFGAMEAVYDVGGESVHRQCLGTKGFKRERVKGLNWMQAGEDEWSATFEDSGGKAECLIYKGPGGWILQINGKNVLKDTSINRLKEMAMWAIGRAGTVPKD